MGTHKKPKRRPDKRFTKRGHKPGHVRRFDRMSYAPCVECGKNGKPVRGIVIYKDRRPDLASRLFYLCDCGAYVGSHGRTGVPLGYPGGTETRGARIRAHRMFDPLWQLGIFPSRDAAYQWLVAATGIDPMRCHIGKLNRAEAERVTRLCEKYWNEHATEKQKAAKAKDAAARWRAAHLDEDQTQSTAEPAGQTGEASS